MSQLPVTQVRRALISVSDKTGITEFAKALSDRGVEILSTGGTFKLLREHQIPAIEVSDHTGFPEMMDGRVKTLHPKFTVAFWDVVVRTMPSWPSMPSHRSIWLS